MDKRWTACLAAAAAYLVTSAALLARAPQTQTAASPSTPSTSDRAALEVTEGVQRGMNIVSSPPTAAAIREVIATASPARQP